MNDNTATLQNVKTCPKCQADKPHDDFYRDKYYNDGLSTYCKACERERTKQYLGSDTRRRYERRRSGQPQRKAKNAVAYAVRMGRMPSIKTLSCECGQPAKHYHHPSYARERWLDVIPVCIPCHTAIHRNDETATATNHSANTLCTGSGASGGV